jgi:tail tube protein
MSQIAFPLTHSGTMPNPVSYIEEETFGTLPSSPTLTAVKVLGDLRPKIDDMEMDVRQVGSHLLYSQQTGGHSYSFGTTIHPFDLPFLKYGTEPPNYTTPAGNQLTSLAFVVRYKQATGTAGMLDHYIKFLGAKCNTTEISVSSQGIVEATQEWICREITKPTSTPISGATYPTFASITSPVLSNVDGGNKPLYINSVQYAVKDFRINWNNNMIPDQFSGSGLIDALTSGAHEVTGSFSTPVGQDLLLEGAIQDYPQTEVVAKYVVKNGTMVINITGLKLITDTPEGFSAGPTQTMQHTYNFKAISASLATS